MGTSPRGLYHGQPGGVCQLLSPPGSPFFMQHRRWATYTAIRKPGCSCPTQRAPRPRDTARPAPA
nr:MAG TPA_asm: hypothetical protein [Caudoviricetes sp.]DAQ33724.1 MAG TPA: hypothetical protein [Caudoviricetes sp.]